WLRRRNLASSGQSQIGGLPIGAKLEGRLRIPSAILGGGGIEIRSRGPSRGSSGRRAQTGQFRKVFSDAGPRVRFLLPPAASQERTGLPRCGDAGQYTDWIGTAGISVA